MAEVLSAIYAACDPDRPASSQYYVDCAEVRGSRALAQKFQGHLARAQDAGKKLCFLFSGHIGCGKSSELRQLEHALTSPAAPHKRYFPILVDINDYLDYLDIDTTDLLLAIVTELAHQFREKLGRELKHDYFDKLLNNIKSSILTEVEIKEAEISLWGAKLKIQRLKRDPEARRKIREALDPRLATLLEETNLLLEAAHLELKKIAVLSKESPYTDLVLIIDNLEKIQRFTGKEQGLPSEQELFVERYAQLKGIQAHIIYTVPLRLVRSHGPQLEQLYGVAPLVLPMVKVIERGTYQPFTLGRECLKDLLGKRLGGRPLDGVFTTEALDFLLTYSGGHVRSLMVFIQEACTYGHLPITLQDMRRAVGNTVSNFSTSIKEDYWVKLARLELSDDQKIPNGDPDYLVMLQNINVLEYINGGEESSFMTDEPWYAVHPIVRELQKFRAAKQALIKVPER